MLLYTSKLLFVGSYTVYPAKFYYLKPLSYIEMTDHREYFDFSNKVHSKNYVLYVSCSLIFSCCFLCVSNTSALSLSFKDF